MYLIKKNWALEEAIPQYQKPVFLYSHKGLEALLFLFSK